jgi:uncharacterized protein (TIGR03437 family)
MKRYAIEFLIPLLLLAPRLSAVPVTYTLTGYVTLNWDAAEPIPFVWTVYADTSGITNPSTGHYRNPAISSYITLYYTGITPGASVPAGEMILSSPVYNITVYLDGSTGKVLFGDGTGAVALINPQFQSWDLASPLGPLTGSNYVMPLTLATHNANTAYITDVGNPGSGPAPSFQALLPPPTITSIQNAASNIPAGLPNAGIAQGAIFAVYGAALGPPALSIAPSPFQTTSLSGTSVAVAVGGTTVNAPLYYTSAGQVAALLPSNTPAGSGTVTVTYNGTAGPAAPVTVVPNNVGIFTVASNGMGPGVVTYPDYSLVSPTRADNCGAADTNCGAANPGDTLTLWATGLGPVSGDDASGTGLGQNMANLSLMLWVGGVQTAVTYQGRSGCCIGEDQIVFTVPDNVPTGCAVPVVAQIGNLVSNTVSIAVAKGSRDCTPSNPVLAAANIRKVEEAGPITYARFNMKTLLGGWETPYEVAQFQLVKILSYEGPTQPFLASYFDDAPAGTCTAYPWATPPDNNGLPAITAAADAGSSFTITGPNGSLSLVNTSASPGQFFAVLANSSFSSTPTSSDLTLIGAGGADIGPFSAPYYEPAIPTSLNAPDLNLPLPSGSNGVTLNWSGAAQDVTLQFQLQTSDSTSTSGATLLCNAPSSAGSFTIPLYVLLALPAGSFVEFSSMQYTEAPVSAPNLNYGVIVATRTFSEQGYTTSAIRHFK